MIYLDNAATTFPKPENLYNNTMNLYRRIGVNPGRGNYSLAQEASDLVEKTREKLALIFKANSSQIILTPSVTYSLNQIINGLGLKKYSSVFISPFEHNAVLRPLKKLETEKNIEINILKFDSSSFIQNQFNNILDCDLLVITHQSNVTGLILPINEICSAIKKKNPHCVTVVDGAQCGGYYPVNWNVVDFYCFSGHKSLYGPSGIAGYINNYKLEITPLLYGGTGIYSESEEMPESGWERYEAGTANILSIIGLYISLQWLQQTGIDAIIQRQSLLREVFINELHRDIRINQVNGGFGAAVSFTVPGFSPQDIELYLSNHDIAVRSGLHCSPLTHRTLDTISTGGTVRVSPGFFNTEVEMITAAGLINKKLQ